MLTRHTSAAIMGDVYNRRWRLHCFVLIQPMSPRGKGSYQYQRELCDRCVVVRRMDTLQKWYPHHGIYHHIVHNHNHRYFLRHHNLHNLHNLHNHHKLRLLFISITITINNNIFVTIDLLSAKLTPTLT